MIGMQYVFTLPDDYDMRTIRNRVAERGHLFDKLEGLFEKAFLISVKGVAGVTENSYAPFYIWSQDEAASNFLVSDKFRAVSEAFGRPAVRTWLPLYFSTNQAKLAKPAFATKEIIDISPESDLEEIRRAEYRVHRQWAEHPANHSGFIGLDAASWQIVRFSLWTGSPDSLPEGPQSFEVVHLSAPGLDLTYFASPC